MESHDHSYVNPNNVTLEWECFVVSKSDMLLDGVPNELINTWLDKDIIKPFSVKNNDINFRTKDVWYALNQQNWY
ncbi:hypothetical protein WL766_06695 [Staphylococcus pasteuri]|uniref:Uncharacterized protein n=2 Tax=Staphylococcus TaxID=1279 RepID=A0ABY1H2K6_9STAP|nr:MULTISPECIES: hypothetical protein [Staphylococcus]ODB34158.1 hypothetical protein A9N02_12855 [Staphylococcus sp. AOAB]RQX27000.1 hypothetical protein DB792_09105 [Staphylococcus warneri]KKI56857.1 hypothetical protein UF70_0500 [Staphylococcus pasteuri]MBL3398308.1 hypothetical protein [Staphylococcus pasteuri]MBM6506754.1 hypothetical protein [Staphylococcus pasteuri]